MKAVRFVAVGKQPEVVEIPKPKPGPGQVLLKIGGAGVCASDLHVLHQEMGLRGPFTLGHENAGWVAELGEGVTGWKEGDAAIVYGPWGCGHCHACQRSAENYCENQASIGAFGGGLGLDGGMAEYMLVPSARLLVPLRKLHPKDAAPLADAALTPYHAIRRALPSLTSNVAALVIGVGGLGHMAVQLLRALSPSRLIAADVDDAKLEHAKKLGADDVINTRDPKAAELIRAITGPRGVAAVIDCVGAQPTLDLAKAVIGMDSHLEVVGIGGGSIAYGQLLVPFACRVDATYWGSRTELMEVIALAEAGRVRAEVTHFPLEQAPLVYEKLAAGQIRGRAVLVP